MIRVEDLHFAWPDGRRIFGQLADHGPSALDEALVAVRLVPSEPIDPALAGQAVELSIRRDASSLFDRFAEAYRIIESGHVRGKIVFVP